MQFCPLVQFCLRAILTRPRSLRWSVDNYKALQYIVDYTPTPTLAKNLEGDIFLINFPGFRKLDDPKIAFHTFVRDFFLQN